MIEVKRIFAECCADTLFVELLLQRGKSTHCGGITEVAKALENFRTNEVVIGFIDTDKFKRDPPFIRKFTEDLGGNFEDENIAVKRIPNTQKYIVRLHPEFEDWIWALCEKFNIDTSKYGYQTIEHLTNDTKNGRGFYQRQTEKIYKRYSTARSRTNTNIKTLVE
jgi:hypothetical protein